MAEKKYVYPFDEAYGLGKELLGGKGAGLAEMSHIGVPVPEGFTIMKVVKKSQHLSSIKFSKLLKALKRKQARHLVEARIHY